MAAKKTLFPDEEAPVKQSESKDVALWQERISIAKKEQEAWAEDSGAKRFVKEYKGDFGIVFHTRNKKVPVPPINEVFAYVQADVATTYNRDPYLTVNATAGTPQGAALWETILNYYWRKLKTKEELEYAIIDKDLIGHGWHKVGYDADKKEIYSNFVGWRDILWNLGAKRPPADAQWMAHRIIKPLAEIKKRFPAAKAMEGTPHPDLAEEVYKKSQYKDDIKVGVMWEIWDGAEKQRLLIGEGVEDRYLDAPKPWPEATIEFPFLMYWDFAIPDSPRPMSAIAPWEAQILEEMVLMGQALNHGKRWNRQAFVNGATFDENSLDKFERGDDAAVITVHGKVGPEDLRFADFGQLPTDFYLLMDRLQAIKRNINGQPEFVRGGTTKTGSRTMGELTLMQQGNKGRQDRKVDRLETHCENIARHMMANLKANFDFEQTIKITGDTPDNVIAALGPAFNPQTGQVTFRPEDIQGEYDVDVKSGSTLPMNKENRDQVLEIVLNTVAAAVPNGPMSPFLNVLIQEILKGHEIKGLQEAYEQEVQQAQQKEQQAAEAQKVEQDKIAAETAKRGAQAQQIGVDTEIAAQDAQLGPAVRALVKKMESHAPVPSESIAYKDLPEDGKIQMAQQAGIHLTSAPNMNPPAKNGSKP